MCQWGAFGMAKKGRKADEIIKYYYPEAKITTVGTIRDKL
jgi:SpoIID/LytB domain protein